VAASERELIGGGSEFVLQLPATEVSDSVTGDLE
jgi:hypothetical protein